MHGPLVSRRYVRPWAVIAALALIAMLVPIIPAAAAPVKAQPVVIMEEIWVDNSVTGPGTGTKADPFKLLTDGLARAGEGSTVHVAEGEYGPDDGETLPFMVPSGVTIKGTMNDDQVIQTVLYGAWGNNVPIMVVENADYVALENLVFSENMNMGTGGSEGAEVPPPSYPGAGLCAFESYVEITNCAFVDLIAWEGSAIFSGGSDLLIEASVFAYNGNAVMEEATAPPAEFKNEIEKFNVDKLPRSSSSTKAQLTMVECEYGGAVIAFESSLDVYNSLFMMNWASLSGGAVLPAYSEAWTTNCVFFKNEASNMINSADARTAEAEAEVYAAQPGGPFGGGAVSNYEGNYWSSRDMFIMNYGDPGAAVVNNTGMATLSRADVYESYGAALVSFDYSIEADSVAPFGSDVVALSEEPPYEPELGFDIDACEIIGNSGIFTTYSSIRPTRITNSLYVGNDALDTVYLPPPFIGGTVVVPKESEYPATSVEGCTFSDNWAEYAIIHGDEYDGTVLVNSIIWGAVDDFSAAAEWSATYVDAWNNDIYGDLDARIDVDNISVDPEFVDADNGNFHLAASSPCIDEGTDKGPVESDILYDPRPWDLDYMKRPNDGDGDGKALYDMGAYEYLPSGRIDGTNRYTTAVETSQQFFGQSEYVVLATGRAFADGLAGSGLAGLYNAPLLLTNGVTLMPEVAAEIERLGAWRVFILGETEAISEDVEAELADMGLDVVRIGGADRYETAALIAEHLYEQGAVLGGGKAFIARGDLFPDALAAAPIAYYNHMPVLLVKPNALPEHTVDVWNEFGISSAVVIGGGAAVSPSVVQALAPPEYERISGANRYETAANLAEWAWDNELAGFWVTGVATGEEFADALSGGAGIGSQNGLLLLTPYASVAPPCEKSVSDHAGEIATMQTFGGLSAVSASVFNYLMALLD